MPLRKVQVVRAERAQAQNWRSHGNEKSAWVHHTISTTTHGTLGIDVHRVVGVVEELLPLGVAVYLPAHGDEGGHRLLPISTAVASADVADQRLRVGVVELRAEGTVVGVTAVPLLVVGLQAALCQQSGDRRKRKRGGSFASAVLFLLSGQSQADEAVVEIAGRVLALALDGDHREVEELRS
ncbi:hypothetical protein TYRP_020250 [Tyrophagus putrescentiae]|nr:hypothetical protein TYRP_020250 [Tyrophagus putrescentiae]